MGIRVYAFWQNPIFCDSIRLILQHPELEWIGSTSSLDTAQADISTHQPEVVLVEYTDVRTSVEFLRIMACSPWGAQIIGLNLHNNQLHLYHREQWTMAKIEDLLKVILLDKQ